MTLLLLIPQIFKLPKMIVNAAIKTDNKEIAIENNCELIYFTSENDNKDAHEFYQKMGYNMNSKGFQKDF